MQEFGLKSRGIKSWIAIFTSSVIVLTMTFMIELNLNEYQVEAQKHMFALVNQGEGNGLFINYDNDKTDELRPYNKQEINLPRYIKAESDLTFKVYGDTYITLSKGSDVRVIIFNKNRIHLSLIEGELILDNRLSSKPSSIQVANTLLKPYQRGVYRAKKYNTKVELESIEGQSLIGIYKDTQLESKRILPKRNILEFDSALEDVDFKLASSKASSLSRYADNDLLLNIDDEIQHMGLFTSKYKGKQVQPEKSRSFASGIIKSLTFNNKKREYLSLYPYQQNILVALESLKAGAMSQASILIDDANNLLANEVAKNPRSINSFKLQVNRDYEALVGLSAYNKLNALKENIEDNYYPYIESEFYLDHLLSLLNDSYILFEKKLNTKAEQKIQKIDIITKAPMTDEDKRFVIKILDNLAAKHPEANFEDTYKLRHDLFDSISTKSSSFKDEYRVATERHLNRLKEYSDEKSISVGKIKRSALVLINSLDSIYQLKYEDFINELNIQGIQLGF
jgi:hypothetical protein